MMFELRPYRNEDLALMPPRERERHALAHEREMYELRLRGPAWTLWGGTYGTEPIGAAGIIVFRPGVGEAWLRGSVRMEHYPRACARAVKQMLMAAAADWRLHRVQMTVRADDCDAVRFALWLGFEVEGLMRCAGEDRGHYLMLAKVAEAGG